MSTSDVQPDEADDDVYSVPTLPGVPLGPGESITSLSSEDATQVGQVYCVPGPEKRASGGGHKRDSSEPDCGIYDMPALTVEVLPHSLSSSSTSTRRLSVSSNGSGDVQWRASLSSLVHSVLSTVSCSASTLSSRDLATSLADILSTWKASHSDDPPPPLQQAWARLSDLLPALSAIGNAPPSEGLVLLVQRSLEESALLLQAQGRPRLPSQESLSRRPLPALPVPDGKSSGGGMGSRKGSWIQERPLPPTPQPAFPLPPTPQTVTLTVGPVDGEDDPSNEYAGIGLTPIPAPVPTGDSVGYVKLQVSFYDEINWLFSSICMRLLTMNVFLCFSTSVSLLVTHSCSFIITMQANVDCECVCKHAWLFSPSHTRANLSHLLTPWLRTDKCKQSLQSQGWVSSSVFLPPVRNP